MRLEDVPVEVVVDVSVPLVDVSVCVYANTNSTAAVTWTRSMLTMMMTQV